MPSFGSSSRSFRSSDERSPLSLRAIQQASECKLASKRAENELQARKSASVLKSMARASEIRERKRSMKACGAEIGDVGCSLVTDSDLLQLLVRCN